MSGMNGKSGDAGNGESPSTEKKYEAEGRVNQLGRNSNDSSSYCFDIDHCMMNLKVELERYKSKYFMIRDKIVSALVIDLEKSLLIIGRKLSGRLACYIIDEKSLPDMQSKYDLCEAYIEIQDEEGKGERIKASYFMNKKIQEKMKEWKEQDIKNISISISSQTFTTNESVINFWSKNNSNIAKFKLLIDDSLKVMDFEEKKNIVQSQSFTDFLLEVQNQKAEKIIECVEKYLDNFREDEFIKKFETRNLVTKELEVVGLAYSSENINLKVFYYCENSPKSNFQIRSFSSVNIEFIFDKKSEGEIGKYEYSINGKFIVIEFSEKFKDDYDFVFVHSLNTKPEKNSIDLDFNSSYKINDKITDLQMDDNDERELLFIGTKLGQVIIIDHRIQSIKFFIDIHKFQISKLILKDGFIYTVGADRRIGKTKVYDLDSQTTKLLEENKSDSLENTLNSSYVLYSVSGIKGEFLSIETLCPNISVIFKREQGKKSVILSKSTVFGQNESSSKNNFENIFIWGNEDSENKSERVEDKNLNKDRPIYNSIVLVENPGKKYLVCAGQFSKLDIYEIEPNQNDSEIMKFKFFTSFKTKSESITSLASFSNRENNKNYFIAGSADGYIIIFKISESNEINKEEIKDDTEEKTKEELKDDSEETIKAPILMVKKINAHYLAQISNILIIDETKVITSSYDKTIKIWNLAEIDKSTQSQDTNRTLKYIDKILNICKKKNNDEENVNNLDSESNDYLIYKIDQFNNMVKYIFLVNNGKYLLTCGNIGDIRLWSLQSYTLIVSINLNFFIYYFFYSNDLIYLSNGDKDLTYNFKIEENLNEDNEDKLKKEENPNVICKWFEGEFLFFGPDMPQKYRAMRYFRRCIKQKLPIFNPDYDKWVVLPILLTSQHLYAFYNMPEHLAQSLVSNTCLNQSTRNHNPLSLAVSKDFQECVDIIVKYLKLNTINNPFIISYIRDDSIKSMNKMGSKSLFNFYSILFSNTESNKLTKSVCIDDKLPVIKESAEAVVNYKNLFNDKINFDRNDQPVVIMRSLVSVPLKMGSEKSVELLQSIIECKNIQIYSTEFIQAYIELKLPTVMKFMYIYAIMYSLYLCLLIAFLVMTEVNNGVLASLTLVAIGLSFYEVLKAIAFGKKYFKNLWNYIDALRTIVFSIITLTYIVNFFKQSDYQLLEVIRYLFLGASITSFIRGVSFFRIFEGTRYFTNLLFQVFIDSKAFFILSVYNILCFSFLFLIAYEFNDSYITHLANTFLVAVGVYSLEEDYIALWIVYVGAVGINNWIMLNIMIAVYSDTFEKVHNTAELYNYFTLAEMAYETECFMGWRRTIRKVNEKVIGKIIEEKSNTINKDDEGFIHMCKAETSSEYGDPLFVKVREIKIKAKDMNLKTKKEHEALSGMVIENRRVIKEFYERKSKVKNENQEIRNSDEKITALKIFKMLVLTDRNNDLNTRKKTKKKIIRNLEKLMF